MTAGSQLLSTQLSLSTVDQIICSFVILACSSEFEVSIAQGIALKRLTESQARPAELVRSTVDPSKYIARLSLN